MLRHSDVLMYLLALKSLCAQLGEGSVVILNDGSLTGEDQDVLRRHIPGLTFHNYADVDMGDYPRGNCWERLLLALDYAKRDFVIQMDADTVTRGTIPEVRQCCGEDHGFTLGSGMGQKVMTPAENAQMLEGVTSSHVQVAAERSLLKVPDAASFRYIRGSAGFAGFPRGFDGGSVLRILHENMAKLLGERWFEWGTEQFASNFVVANTPAPVVLQRPRYSSFDPKIDYREAAFLHFVGTHRFKQGTYVAEARRITAALLESSGKGRAQG